MIAKDRQAYFLIILFVLLAYAECVNQPSRMLQLVSTNRTETLFLRCPKLRKDFNASQRNESQSWGRLQTEASLKWDGDALIHAILSNDTTEINTQVRNNLASTIIYVIFILIGLVVMIIFAPIMICCSCLPKKCPPCRKDQYSSCQKTWPAVCIVFVAIIAIGSMIGILIVNGEFKDSYSQTRCSVAIFFDDLINGNYTYNQSEYFIGLKPLKANLSTQVASEAPTLKSTPTSIVDEIESIKVDVSRIPSSSQGQLDLKYVSPINIDPQTVTPGSPTTLSKFNAVLGQASLGDSLIGQIYAALQSLKQSLKQSLSSSGLGQLPSPLQKYAQLVGAVEKLDANIDLKLENAEKNFVNPISIAIYAMAAISLFFCVLVFIAALMVCICKKFSCRYLLYCSCTFLTLLGILCFALALVFSVTTAGTHYGCHYVEGSLQTRAQFQYNFGPIFDNALLTKMVAQCATMEGTGIIVNSARQLSSPSQIRSQLASYKQKLTETIKYYSQAEIADLDSPSDIKILQNLSDSNKYTCSATGFPADSWVPSTNQQQVYVPCKLPPQTQSVTHETCQSAEFQNPSSNCRGCIDTFSVLSPAQTFENVLSTLKSRYPTQDCSTFIHELSNVWINFYKKKADALKPVEEKANLVSKRIDGLLSENKLSSISAEAPPLQLPVTQLSCKVLGQDLVLLTNTFCTRIFNFSFKMRILTIIGSFCLLLIMFCSTCLGMRTYKQDGKYQDGNQHISPIESQQKF